MQCCEDKTDVNGKRAKLKSLLHEKTWFYQELLICFVINKRNSRNAVWLSVVSFFQILASDSNLIHLLFRHGTVLFDLDIIVIHSGSILISLRCQTARVRFCSSMILVLLKIFWPERRSSHLSVTSHMHFISGTFLPLSKVKWFDVYFFIARSRITELPNAISRSRSLMHIDVSDTLLKSLPDNFGNLTSLVYLDISGTPLTSLPKSFADLKNLKVLKLSGVFLSRMFQASKKYFH